MSSMQQTIPALIRNIVNETSNSAALCYRYLGVWEKISTERLTESIRKYTLGLQALGMKPGTGMGIISRPSPFWVMMDMAIMTNRAISIPMFPNISVENFVYQCKDAAVRYLFIEDSKLLDPSIRKELPKFQKVITMSLLDSGANFIHLDQVIAMGEELSQQEPAMYHSLMKKLEEDDVATIIYTSGSTGIPKGVEITHKNLVSQLRSAKLRFPLNPAKDRVLTALPFAHIFERMVIYYFISTGTTIFFADDIQRVGELLRELRPTVMTLVPRLLEKVYAKMEFRMREKTGLARFIGMYAFHRAIAKPYHKKSWLDPLLDKLVYEKLREALGGNFRLIISGGAAMPAHIGNFCLNIGLPVYEGYGLTETSPVISANFPGHNKLGTVGTAFPGVEIRISATNEILARGPGVMRGYHNNPKATAEVLNEEGWFHTGDLGSLDKEGYLTITGRAKDLFKTSTGKYVAPIPIEQQLQQMDLIDMAVVIAEKRNCVCALLFADVDAMTQHKKNRSMEAVSDTLFWDDERIQTEIEHRIQALNHRLNNWEKIRGWLLITLKPTIESGLLTPTMKLRRHAVEEQFAQRIDDMFNQAQLKKPGRYS
jgi:long-chain acyl-CoA synthetase